MSGPDHSGGCGRLTVVAEPVERLIADAVLYRLDTPELADALAGKTAGDERSAALSEKLARDQARLEELAQVYGTGQITLREWLIARKPIESSIETTSRHLAQLSSHQGLTTVIGQGQALRGHWADLNLGRQHTIVASLLSHAVIAPGAPGARTMAPDRVQPVWIL